MGPLLLILTSMRVVVISEMCCAPEGVGEGMTYLFAVDSLGQLMS